MSCDMPGCGCEQMKIAAHLTEEACPSDQDPTVWEAAAHWRSRYESLVENARRERDRARELLGSTEAQVAGLIERRDRAEAELDEAWQASGATTVRGMVPLADVVGQLRTARDEGKMFPRVDPAPLHKVLAMRGSEAQMRHMQEECAELIVAINHKLRGRTGDEPCIEELADVLLVAAQMRIVLGRPVVDAMVGKKLARLEEQLKKGGA